MENTPIIYEKFSEEIWPQSREALLTKISEHARNDIGCVVLDVASRGGEVESAMTLCEQLLSTPVEFVARAKGEVASMGIVLFLACDRRLAFPEATFFMHPITVKTPTGWPTVAPWLDIEDIRKLRARVERSGAPPKLFTELDLGIVRLTREEKEVQKIFEERTNLTGSAVSALVRGRTSLSAAEAYAVGIVDEIIPARRS